MDAVSEKACVDRSRIFGYGESNGGMLLYDPEMAALLREQEEFFARGKPQATTSVQQLASLSEPARAHAIDLMIVGDLMIAGMRRKGAALPV